LGVEFGGAGAGRPLFNELLFGRCRPTYVAFDLLIADALANGPRAGSRSATALSAGAALYRAVVEADLEDIVAKHLANAYHPKLARWHKILNRTYSQRRGRAEWFRDGEDAPDGVKGAKRIGCVPV
jgi:hypothetical protein